MLSFNQKLELLKCMQRPFFYSTYSICANLLGPYYEAFDHDTLIPLMSEWPESYCVDGIYPIEGNREDYCTYSDARWIGEHGARRRRLAAFLFDRFMTFGMQ